jgi:hypothetical protein
MTRVSKVRIRNLARSLPLQDDLWMDSAACKGRDVNLFVYSADEPSDRQRKELTRICSSCTVMMECRYEGLRTLSDGWWGGMTPQERFEWAQLTILSEQLKED